MSPYRDADYWNEVRKAIQQEVSSQLDGTKKDIEGIKAQLVEVKQICVSKDVFLGRANLVDDRTQNNAREIARLRSELRERVKNLEEDLKTAEKSSKDALEATEKRIYKDLGWVNKSKNLAVSIAVAVIVVLFSYLKITGKL